VGEGVGVGPALAREHHVEQGRVAGGEVHPGPCEGCEPGRERAVHLLHRRVQLTTEALESVLREGIEQGLLVGEVAARGAVADSRLPGHFAQ